MSTVSVQHCQFKNTIVIMSTVSEQCCQHCKFIQLSIRVLTMTNLVHIVSFHNCHYDQSVYNYVNIIFIMSTVSQYVVNTVILYSCQHEFCQSLPLSWSSYQSRACLLFGVVGMDYVWNIKNHNQTHIYLLSRHLN